VLFRSLKLQSELTMSNHCSFGHIDWRKEDFDFGKQLGHGRFGRVYLARERKTAHELIVAIKVLKKESLMKTKSENNFKEECENQSKLRHPNITRLYTWFHNEKCIFIILEFSPNGNLLEKLAENGSFNNRQASTYIYQITKALCYIHSQGIAHRDLKPENCLIGVFGEIKLADFGWSFKFDNSVENKESAMAGTLDYLSPEIISNEGYDKKIDNWCLGILTFELLVGETPFIKDSKAETCKSILNVKYQFPANVVRSARAFITKLLLRNPVKRMELWEVFDNEWIEKNADKDNSYEQFFEESN